MMSFSHIFNPTNLQNKNRDSRVKRRVMISVYSKKWEKITEDTLHVHTIVQDAPVGNTILSDTREKNYILCNSRNRVTNDPRLPKAKPKINTFFCVFL